MANIELREKLELSAEDIKAIRDYEEAKSRYDLVISKNDEMIKNFMRARVESGLEPTLIQDGLIITYKAPYTRNGIDTNKLREDGLYDKYLKETQVKDSVNVKIKYDD